MADGSPTQPRAKTWAERIAQGFCGNCGRRPPREGEKICQYCSDQRKRRADALYAEGKCVGCRLPHDSGNRYCDRCLLRAKVRTVAREDDPERCTGCMNKRRPGKKRCGRCAKNESDLRKSRRAQGLCLCGAAPVPGKNACTVCLERRARRTNRKVERSRALGFCTSHPNVPVAPGHVLKCVDCVEAGKLSTLVWRAKQTEKGLCTRCTRKALPGKKHCQYHADYQRKQRAKRRQREAKLKTFTE